MTNATREFLDSLKPGDQVPQLKNSRIWGDTVYTYQVKRLTATQIVMTNDDHFRKSDGKLVGSAYTYLGSAYTYLQMPPSAVVIEQLQREKREKMRRVELREIIRDRVDDASLETLEAVVALLSQPPAAT